MAPTTQSLAKLYSVEPKQAKDLKNKGEPQESEESTDVEDPKRVEEHKHVEKYKHVEGYKHFEEPKHVVGLKKGEECMTGRNPNRAAGSNSHETQISKVNERNTQRKKSKTYKGRGMATWIRCDLCGVKVEYEEEDDSLLCSGCGIPWSMS